MAISKRLRYEVLKRDGFTCRYCGRGAPAVELRVDHVIPSSLDGPDTIDNLVAACHDCNAGKGSTVLDLEAAATATTGSRLWREAMLYASCEQVAELSEVEEACEILADAWDLYRTHGGKGSPIPMGPEWRSSVKNWIMRGCPCEVLLDAVPIAMGRQKVAAENTWRYFCGIVWNKLRDLEERAATIVNDSAFVEMRDGLRENLIEEGEMG